MDVLVCLISKCYCIIVFLVLLLMALFFWCCCVYWVSVVLYLSGCFYLPQYFPLGSSLCPLSLVVRLLDPFMLLWSLLVSMFLSLCPLLSMLTGVLCLLWFCLFFMHFKLWSLFHLDIFIPRLYFLLCCFHWGKSESRATGLLAKCEHFREGWHFTTINATSLYFY